MNSNACTMNIIKGIQSNSKILHRNGSPHTDHALTTSTVSNSELGPQSGSPRIEGRNISPHHAPTMNPTTIMSRSGSHSVPLHHALHCSKSIMSNTTRAPLDLGTHPRLPTCVLPPRPGRILKVLPKQPGCLPS
eukprot:gene20076-7151_t